MLLRSRSVALISGGRVLMTSRPDGYCSKATRSPLQIFSANWLHRCDKGLAFQVSALLKKIPVAPSGGQTISPNRR